MNNIIYFNNAFVPEEEAKISVRTHALQYGTGVFEGIRAYYNEEDDTLVGFRLLEHYQRMALSCKTVFMTLPHSPKELVDITAELLKKNFEASDIYIRPFAYKSEETVSSFDLSTLKDGFTIYTMSMGRYLNTKGLKANISSWKRVSDNAIPPRAKISGSYINTALAKTESTLNGFDEALFLDDAGHIVEGSAENIFVIKDKTIITPPVSDDILKGITRHTLMTLVKDHTDLAVVERSLGRTEVYQADEVFLVGTGAEVAPVIEIDKRSIGTGKPGTYTQQLKDLYFDVVHGKVEQYNDWYTKVTK